jgi:hypothetical protein
MKTPDIFHKIDRFLCNKLPDHLSVRWARLWVRRDEFHPSLNPHINYVVKLPARERELYWRDLLARREIAHKRDLAT